MICRGDLRKRLACLELVEHTGCLGIEARCHFLLAPARLDLIFHLLERTLARGRDPGDVVPDISVFELQRIALDPDVGGERGGQKALRIG
jgi:hypothetical protein